MPLEGFEAFPFTDAGATRDVYRRGSGPGVVVIHEIPGITPEVARFGRRVADDGFTAFLPHLFGTPGKPFSNAYVLSQMARACVSREFAVLARRSSRESAFIACGRFSSRVAMPSLFSTTRTESVMSASPDRSVDERRRGRCAGRNRGVGPAPVVG